VLRSCDTRFRRNKRSSEVYPDASCRSFVGKVTTVVDIPAGEKAATTADDVDEAGYYFWATPSYGMLQIIAVCYKPGVHQASRPTDFLQVIEQLEMMHGAGYVHGDIRGFNVVYGEHGGLIDFDFSGKEIERKYPAGYHRFLDDGYRIGTGEVESEDNTLTFYHDWYALGHLMFFLHKWKSPPTIGRREKHKFHDAKDLWTSLESNPSPAEIRELKYILRDVGLRKWLFRPNKQFQELLDATVNVDGSNDTVK
jgi:hypothetical protein